jgi:hypothetical protein
VNRPLLAAGAGLVVALAACTPPAAPAGTTGAAAAGGAVPGPPPVPPELASAAGAAAPAGQQQAARSQPQPVGQQAPPEVPWTPGVWEPPPADVEPWGVWIPRIDVSATLGELGLEADGRLQVPDDVRVAGWYVGGPRPGEVGPAVVAGHVDSRSGPAVFARLRELREGDVAHVVYRDGFVATFRIGAVRRYGKDAFPTAAVYGDTPGPTLRLITCGGDFDRSAGSYRDNVVAFGEILGTWRYDPAG